MSGGWNTIESDAGVFTYLIEKLGVQGVQFEELISLDAESLLQLSPIHGLIFLFKYPINEPPPSNPSEPNDGTYDHTATETLFFANQVIQNACGTQALLSVLLNKDTPPPSTTAQTASTTTPPTTGINIGPHLRNFRDFTAAFPSSLRGEALSNDELIRSVHNSFARSAPFIDETVRVAQEEDDVFHFIAYAPLNGVLYELDGLQAAPIAHGACKDETEDGGAEFAEKVVEVVRRRMQRYDAGEVRFNLLALCGDLREKARRMGDQERLEQEEAKRRSWMWENCLRRHNFLGFTKGILEGVVRAKVEEGSYDEWVGGAKERTKKKIEARKAGKIGASEEMDVDA